MGGVVILGTGGMGREALAWLEATVAPPDVRGFLDEDDQRHGTHVAGHEVLGGLDWLDDEPDVEVVVAIGAPAGRARAVADLDRRSARLASIVHPSAVIGPRVTLGPGTIVCPGVILTCDVTVGRAVILNYGAMVGHDGRIGDFAFVAPGAHLAGNVTVGAAADVGIGATVIQGITVGHRAVVGAGAAVVRDVPDDTVVVGVPARALRSVS